VIDLDAVARAAGCFEPLPTSVRRLATVAAGESPDLAEIVDIVRYDQALTAALLRSANSSWSAARTEIATVRDAVVRLGAGPVLALALGVNVRGRMESAIPAYELAEGELWNHSVMVMLAAETLMAHGGTPLAEYELPAETPTAALLHDVGKLVMTRFVERSELDAISVARAGGLTRMHAERDVLGVEHAELGGTIARGWGLPASLVAGIAAHHSPGSAPGGTDPIVHGVHLADVVAKAVGGGLDDNADLEAFALAMGDLGVSVAGFDDVCARVADRFAEVSARFA
jgi:putative nucleotidyltransferase with HDIG domain